MLLFLVPSAAALSALLFLQLLQSRFADLGEVLAIGCLISCVCDGLTCSRSSSDMFAVLSATGKTISVCWWGSSRVWEPFYIGPCCSRVLLIISSGRIASLVVDVRHFTSIAEFAGTSAGLISKRLDHKIAAALKMDVELLTDEEEVNRDAEYKRRM